MTLDYAKARENMVEQQVRPWDVLDMAVLETVGRLPREAFVPEAHRALAYADLELPLGHGARMMKPVVEGRMLQALQLQPGDSVLEVGTGSGYISACLGALARDACAEQRVREAEDQGDLAALAAIAARVRLRLQTEDAAQAPLDWAADQIALARVGRAVERLSGHAPPGVALALAEAAAIAGELGAPTLARRAEALMTPVGISRPGR